MGSERPDSLYKGYLIDLVPLIQERLEDVKSELSKISDRESGDYVFNSGQQLAFMIVLSIMRNQAIAFDIPLSEVKMDNIDPNI